MHRPTGIFWANLTPFSLKASLLNTFNELAIWTQQFDAVLARMKAGDNSLLAPTIPTPIIVVLMAVTMMKTAVSKKELALLGVRRARTMQPGPPS